MTAEQGSMCPETHIPEVPCRGCGLDQTGDAEAAARLAQMTPAERRDLLTAYAGSLYMKGMSWAAAITLAEWEARELLRPD